MHTMMKFVVMEGASTSFNIYNWCNSVLPKFALLQLICIVYKCIALNNGWLEIPSSGMVWHNLCTKGWICRVKTKLRYIHIWRDNLLFHEKLVCSRIHTWSFTQEIRLFFVAVLTCFSFWRSNFRTNTKVLHLLFCADVLATFRSLPRIVLFILLCVH